MENLGPPINPPSTSNRINAEDTLDMMVNARNPQYWANISGFVDRFDPSWCVTLLYNETDVLRDQDGPEARLISGTLIDAEFPAAAALLQVWDPMVDEYDRHDSVGHLTDARWPEVERRAAALLELMRSNDAAYGLLEFDEDESE